MIHKSKRFRKRDMLKYSDMRIKLFMFIMAVFFVVPVFGQGVKTKRVAILDAVDKEDKVPYHLELSVRAILTVAITDTPGYEGYDRVDLASIIGEHDFQRTGLVSDDDIKELGRMTGADFILISELAMQDANHVTIMSKILDVETSKVENSSYVSSSISQDELEKSCRKLASKLLGSRPGSSAGLQNGYAGPYVAASGGQDFVETALGLNMKMVYVQGGDFLMGATSEQGSDAENDEKTIRRVRLDSYYIGECEVTQAQWQKVMGTSIYQQASKAGVSAKATGPDYPMYYVSWEEAQAFCRELSRLTGRTYCLPTEAQWEYAARGGNKNDGTKYSGSWSIDAVAWYDGNSGANLHPVKNKRANALGLYDMSGNVWEWCTDWYSESYNVNDTNNPTGASSGLGRVLRGGSWRYNARSCRVSYRFSFNPSSRFNGNGFRVVVLP